jgi:hypothetical protein
MRNVVALHGLRRKVALLSVVMVAQKRNNGVYARIVQGLGRAGTSLALIPVIGGLSKAHQACCWYERVHHNSGGAAFLYRSRVPGRTGANRRRSGLTAVSLNPEAPEEFPKQQGKHCN